MIINQLLSIASFSAIGSFKGGDLMQMLVFVAGQLVPGSRHILQNLRAGINTYS
ncbi:MULTISPECIES: hypothetical protein [unclassified Microcoleus]|uniref:hypothetical protein n=1 Tax=unclassified Microcoleus TaxID=2642155 RepID=UPI002FD29974